MERTVTWSTYVMEHSFVFTSGIITDRQQAAG